MRRAVGTLIHDNDMDWGPGMLALAESLSTHSAYLYRYNRLESTLHLISRTSNEEEVPFIIPVQGGILGEALFFQQSFYNETQKFGLSGFGSPYLVLSSLQFEKKIFGLLIISTKKIPSRKELDFVSAKALHFSLLVAIEEAEQDKDEWQKKSSALEQKLVAAYQRVQESDKLATLGQFAGGLAHEFNTPLGAIQTYAEYLQLFVKGDAERESLEGILKAVTHCRDIVENVLRLSHNGKRDFEPIVLRHVIHDALILTEPEMERVQISVGSELLANPVVVGNHTRLVQVVTNLLNNARDSLAYSRLLPRKGGVKITLSCDESMAIIEVLDNGPGISKKNLGQVFNPFFTTKEVGQGTGLGLSISHAIVEEHLGTIEILSEEGQGTRVVVRLPMIDERSN